jgi:hypothetical protein
LQQLVDQGKLLWEDLVPESSSSHHLHLHSHNPLPQHQAFVSPPVAVATTTDMSVWNLTSVGVSNKIPTASVNPLLARGISKTIPRNRQIELDACWDRHMAALLEYGQVKGHYNVPFAAIYESETYVGSLGNWVHLQRLAKSGIGRKLNTRQEAALLKLEEAGKFSFGGGDVVDVTTVGSQDTTTANATAATAPLVLTSSSSVTAGAVTGAASNINIDTNELPWETHFTALLQYQVQHGHCNVPKGFSYECIIPDIGDDSPHGRYVGHLGSWLCYQRRLKKKDKSALLPDREGLLQQLVDEGEYTIVLYI